MESYLLITNYLLTRTGLRCRIGCLDFIHVISLWRSVLMAGSRKVVLAAGRAHRIEYKATSSPPKMGFKVDLILSSVFSG